MSRRFTTAGVELCYAVETTAGTMPTSGYKVVPEIKSMPSLNEEPNQIDSTTLLETEYETSEPGLKSNSVKSYTANLTDDLIDFWEDVQDEYETASAAGKAMWFCHRHPKVKECAFYKGVPSPLGWNELAPNGILETTLYITASSGVTLAATPTLDSSSL